MNSRKVLEEKLQKFKVGNGQLTTPRGTGRVSRGYASSSGASSTREDVVAKALQQRHNIPEQWARLPERRRSPASPTLQENGRGFGDLERNAFAPQDVMSPKTIVREKDDSVSLVSSRYSQDSLVPATECSGTLVVPARRIAAVPARPKPAAQKTALHDEFQIIKRADRKAGRELVHQYLPEKKVEHSREDPKRFSRMEANKSASAVDWEAQLRSQTKSRNTETAIASRLKASRLPPKKEDKENSEGSDADSLDGFICNEALNIVITDKDAEGVYILGDPITGNRLRLVTPARYIEQGTYEVDWYLLAPGEDESSTQRWLGDLGATLIVEDKHCGFRIKGILTILSGEGKPILREYYVTEQVRKGLEQARTVMKATNMKKSKMGPEVPAEFSATVMGTAINSGTDGASQDGGDSKYRYEVFAVEDSVKITGRLVVGQTVSVEYTLESEVPPEVRWYTLTKDRWTFSLDEHDDKFSWVLSPDEVGTLLRVALRFPKGWLDEKSEERILMAETIEEVQRGPPLVIEASVVGDPVEGNALHAEIHVDYGGSTAGNCLVYWFRKSLEESGAEVNIPQTRGLYRYLLTQEDVGKRVGYKFTPVNEEGFEGEEAHCRSDQVKPAMPRIVSMELRNIYAAREMIFEFVYFGGIASDVRVKWQRSIDGKQWIDIETVIVPAGKSHCTCMATADFLSHYIQVDVWPTRSDGAKGNNCKTHAFCRIHPKVRTQLQAVLKEGIAGFHVTHLGEPMILLLTHSKVVLIDTPQVLEDAEGATPAPRVRTDRGYDPKQIQDSGVWDRLKNRIRLECEPENPNNFRICFRDGVQNSKEWLLQCISQEVRDITVMTLRAFASMGDKLMCTYCMGKEVMMDWHAGKLHLEWKRQVESKKSWERQEERKNEEAKREAKARVLKKKDKQEHPVVEIFVGEAQSRMSEAFRVRGLLGDKLRESNFPSPAERKQIADDLAKLTLSGYMQRETLRSLCTGADLL